MMKWKCKRMCVYALYQLENNNLHLQNERQEKCKAWEMTLVEKVHFNKLLKRVLITELIYFKIIY